MVRLDLDIDLPPFRTLMPSRLPAGLALPAHNLPNFSNIPQDPSRCLQIENFGSQILVSDICLKSLVSRYQSLVSGIQYLYSGCYTVGFKQLALVLHWGQNKFKAIQSFQAKAGRNQRGTWIDQKMTRHEAEMQLNISSKLTTRNQI